MLPGCVALKVRLFSVVRGQPDLTVARASFKFATEMTAVVACVLSQTGMVD